jgi:hypothetical protein
VSDTFLQLQNDELYHQELDALDIWDGESPNYGMTELDPEAQRILNENLWKLYGEEEKEINKIILSCKSNRWK